jgi:hypothetical protein
MPEADKWTHKPETNIPSYKSERGREMRTLEKIEWRILPVMFKCISEVENTATNIEQM